MTQWALFFSFCLAASLVVNNDLYKFDVLGSCWIDVLPLVDFAVGTIFEVLTFAVVDDDDWESVDAKRNKRHKFLRIQTGLFILCSLSHSCVTIIFL